MIRRLTYISLLVCACLIGAVSKAEVPPQTPLYGIPPGTKLNQLKAILGDAAQRIPFDDGWVATVYQFKEHNVIVETSPDDPEYVVAVQIAGYSNPAGKGLLNVDLGDNIESAFKAFGKPMERRQSVDERTNQEVPDTYFYQYKNASFESTEGKITSIKVNFERKSIVTDGHQEVVEAVRNYILNNDYPEVFGDKRYRVKVENLIVADLDGDGVPEVIAHMKPHFRQSPTIVIYKVSKDLEVHRVMEGLAPGPLQTLSSKYLDSHSLGEGVDFQANMKPGYSARDGLVGALLKSQKGNLVLYKQFAHMDVRLGPPSYIDMREADLPRTARNCETFEFSDVENVEVSPRFSSDGRNIIAAHVGGEIYMIRIERFLPNGLLEKSVSVYDH